MSKLPTQWNKCINKLKEEKFFVLEDFLDSETCDIIVDKVDNLIAEVNELNQDTEKKLNENSRLMVINQKVKGAGKGSKWMDDQEKTLVNIRGNRHGDTGFKDIFNPNKSIEEVEELRKNHLLGKIASEYGRDPNRVQCNIYHSEGITDTRRWHRDTKMIKLFVYLTDVLSDDDGPYCYTNKDYKAVKFLNKKGTLIGTFQDVRHRGWPMGENNKRVVFVYKIYLGKGRDY